MELIETSWSMCGEVWVFEVSYNLHPSSKVVLCQVSLLTRVNGCRVGLVQKFLSNPKPCIYLGDVVLAIQCCLVMFCCLCLQPSNVIRQRDPLTTYRSPWETPSSCICKVWGMYPITQAWKEWSVEAAWPLVTTCIQIMSLSLCSFRWWQWADVRQIRKKPSSVRRYLSSPKQIRRCIFCKMENCQEGNLKLHLLPRHFQCCLNNLTIMGIDSWLLILTVTYD